MVLPIIDAHLHVWDPTRLDYAWLAGLPALNRTFVPADLDTGERRLAGAVFVEAGCRADQSVDEVRWVTELAERWPTIRAIVAHAPVEFGPDTVGALADLAEFPLVTGIRRNLQDEAAGFASSDEVISGVRLAAEAQYTFDLCIRRSQLPEVTELVARVPTATFVLDHLGKPAVANGLLDPWRDELSRLAAHPNVVCKLSGLATEADHERWQSADVLPYLRHALAEFGPDRCMVGGDWPVATLATSYRRWMDVVAEALAGLTDRERAAVTAETATRVYRLRPSF